MQTGFFTTKSYIEHQTGNGHPECSDRVSAIISTIKKKNPSGLKIIDTPKLNQDVIRLAHSNEYINFVNTSFPQTGLKFLDADTIISPGSNKASLDAVSAVINAIDMVKNKKIKNAFCAIRPPGHHAEKNKAMGFCIFNNVAIGANYLIDKYNYKKVAIIDFDVHHGNGTQDIVYDNKKILYISTHQYPFYPGTGSGKEKGKFNNVLNIPLPAGTDSYDFLNAYEHVLKKLDEFKPEFLIFSAGFDAHMDDPLANFKLLSKDFHEITKRTLITTKPYCQDNVVSVLEGGYNLNALSESVEQHLGALVKF